MRAALYCRVSSDRQAQEGDSIAAQLDALNKYASERKYTIIGTFVDDGISGTKYDRDELQRMLSEVEAGHVDIVLVTKMDRLHRSLRNFLNMQDTLDRHGCAWCAIWEPQYDTSTPQGRMIVNTMMNLAQFEAEQTGERVRQVFGHKTQNREVLSGNAPPGYSIIDKHLVPNADADKIRRAFEIYDSTNSLAETVRAVGGNGLPVTVQGMKYLLKRRVYIGERNGVPDFCEPIVERDLFDRVQIALSRNIKRSQKRTYLFSSLIRCAHCGATLSSGTRNDRGKLSQYYRCRHHYQRMFDRCENNRTVYEYKLEKMLLDMLPDIVIEETRRLEEQQKPVEDYEKKKKALEKKLERLKVLFVNDEITLDEYRHDKADLLDQIARLAPVTRPEPRGAILSLEGMNIREVYEILTKDEQRMFWRGIIKEIRVDKELHFYFDFL